MTEHGLKREHQRLGARFHTVGGVEVVSHYGDPAIEYEALRRAAVLVDLSPRGRLAVTGRDRLRFVNGQVTNNVRDLRPGHGCYAAVVSAKGRVQGDANIYCLAEELLLDCEPGYGGQLTARLEQYIIADDVRVVDLSAEYGLLSVQGPLARETLARAFPGRELPARPWCSVVWPEPGGEICAVNLGRVRLPGLELFVPGRRLGEVWTQLREAVAASGGCPAGWECLEWARVEAGMPRYGQDMDDRNLAPEAGIESRAISYTKGCYIGQEVISRLRSIGQVTRSLRGLELEDADGPLPQSGDRMLLGGREVGYLTSAVRSPGLGRAIGLGYVRREVVEPGTLLEIQTQTGTRVARLRPLPDPDVLAPTCV
jgi:folate-binding protein YgfZ